MVENELENPHYCEMVSKKKTLTVFQKVRIWFEREFVNELEDVFSAPTDFLMVLKHQSIG